jgi:hypothetical protein
VVTTVAEVTDGQNCGLAAEFADRLCDVSIVLPCQDEEDAVGQCVRDAARCLADAGLRGEVVVCNNASRDRSDVVATTAGGRVVFESLPGYGAALATGFAAARGRYLVMADADGSYDLTAVGPMLALLSNGYDLVVGNRFRGSMERGSMPWMHRYIGSPLLSLLLNLLFGTRVGDVQSGLRAFSREAYARMGLRTTGMEFASEMIVRAAGAGLRIGEVPANYRCRIGDSKLRRYRDGWRHLRFLLMYSPTWLYLLPSAVFGCLGLALLLVLAATRIQFLGRSWDMHLSAVASLVTVLSVQLAWLGISARTFAVIQGFVQQDRLITRFYERFTLEVGLGLSTLLVVGGAAAMFYVVAQWARQGFTDLDAIRPLLLGTTLVIVGVQSAFNAFFLSLLGNARPVAATTSRERR